MAAPEGALPQSKADHGDWAGVGLIFLAGEGATQDRPRAEDLEPLRTYGRAGEMLDPAVVQQIEIGGAHNCRSFHLVVEGRCVRIVGDRDTGKVHAELLVTRTLDRNALRMVHARGVAEDSIHHAEDGAVGSDAQCKGNDRGDGEARYSNQLPERMSQVVEDHR